MKRLTILFVMLAACLQIRAQNNSLYINSAGNVGVGAPNPLAPLDVSGALRLDNGTTQSNYFTTLTPRYDSTHPFSLSVENNTGGNALEILGVYSPGGGGSVNLSLGLNGNVGIGTTSPASPLTIVNNGGNALVVQGSSTNSIGLMIANTASNGHSFSLYSSGGGPAAAGSFGVYDNNAGTSRLAIAANGNVGIGTTTPVQELDLRGSAGAPATSGTIQNGLLRFEQTADFGILDMGVQPGGAGAWLQSGNLSTLAVYYPLLLNPNGGNVGIGTTSPQYALDIPNGQVHAQEFIATSGSHFPDFVFKPDYKLPPLNEVEAAIKKDGHLPGIPSEAEAKAHGIDLAQMQVKLLQKIEELTLHQIEQEKRLDEQARRIEQLEKENAALKGNR